MNDKILAVMTADPQSANAIAAALNAKPPAIRRALKALREAGLIGHAKVRGILNYTTCKVAQGHQRTREELHALQIERGNGHRDLEKAATTDQDKKLHRERAERREARALTLA